MTGRRSRVWVAAALVAAVVSGCRCATECRDHSDCGPDGVCVNGLCYVGVDGGAGGGGGGAAGGSGGGGGGAAGGSGGGGGGGGGGGAPSYCDPGLSCSPAWSACRPTPDGGVCEEAVGVRFEAPQPGQAFPPSAQVSLRVVPFVADSGVWVGATVPYNTDFGASGVLVRDAGFQTSVDVGAGDGQRTASAGWAGGPDASVAFRVDALPPVLTVTVQAVPARPGPWSAATGNAWRRDEFVHVLAQANEDLLPDSGIVRVGGVAAASDAGLADCAAVGLACGAPARCFCARADLSLPPLLGLDGGFGVEASAADLVGLRPANAADGGQVHVTRLRWVADFGTTTLKTTPAIGRDGTLYVGTSEAATVGRLVAVHPDGDAGWSVSLGSFEGSPAYGEENGNQYVFYSVNTPVFGAVLGALFAPDGGAGTFPTCYNAQTSRAYLSPVLQLLTVPLASGVLSCSTVQNQAAAGVAALATITPAVSGSAACSSQAIASAEVDSSAPANMVASGSRLFFATANARIRAYEHNMSWPGLTNPLWSPVTVAGAGTVNGLLLLDAGTKIIGGAGSAAVGQLFQIDALDGGVDWRAPATTNAGQAGAPVAIDMNNIYFGFSDGGTPALNRLGQAATDFTAALPTAQLVQVSPVLGEGGLLYAVSSQGTLTVADRSLALRWRADGFGVGITAAPTLGCNQRRPGGPGVLYLVNPTGTVHAVLVDSPKLATDAQWPKYQHDAQNSGNAGFQLNLDCP